MRLRLFSRRRAPDRPLRQRGFSRFEFALAAALFATLVGVAANRLGLYQQRVESVAAEQLIASLHVALRYRVSHLTATQRQHEVLTFIGQNPIDWLSEKPRNYLGEYYSPDIKNLTKGSWYFDRSEQTLVYLPTYKNGFALGSLILLKFKVKSLRLPLTPTTPVQSAVIANVALVQVIEPTGVGGQ